jgi:steroid 5-alpha reductase family enzyme
MTSTWFVALFGLGLILSVMILLWVVSLLRRDASIVDPFWGTGFILLAWMAYLWQPTTAPRPLLLCGLVTLWGLRLSLYLLWRNWGQGEDHRYLLMRQHHGRRFWWVSLFTVFLLQAIILWIVALPILMATIPAEQPPLNAWDAAGIFVWTIGVFFETVGDWQLARFRSNPANRSKVLSHGLWRYTRHPNYFGDFCVWWGFYLIAFSGGAWWTMISPLIMSILLMRISGVTLLESTIQERRPEYAAYRRATNAFFPGLPKA